MMPNSLRISTAVLFLAIAVGCSRTTVTDVVPTPDLGFLPDGPARPEHEATWTAVLRAYRDGSVPTQGDLILETRRAMGGAGGGPAPIVLMARRDSSYIPFRRAWLDSILTAQLVDYVCVAPEEASCPGTFVATFLSLGDPKIEADSAATVFVEEVGLQPSACGAGSSMGGFMHMTHRLRRAHGGWRATSRTLGVSGTTYC
jgi:hypothetical protein